MTVSSFRFDGRLLVAGMDVPMTHPWTVGRWVVLGAGAFVGLYARCGWACSATIFFTWRSVLCGQRTGVGHGVSSSQFSLMKASVCFCCFVCRVGRSSGIARSRPLFPRLLLACEIGVYVSAFAYTLGLEIWGNAILWAQWRSDRGSAASVGALVAPTKNLRVRRAVACLGALYWCTSRSRAPLCWLLVCPCWHCFLPCAETN